MKHTFSKYHSAGNDFILLDNFTQPISPTTTTNLCNRHTGIGADGILLSSPDPNAHARMTIYNADGSPAAMCGNGLRCLAFHLASKLHTTPMSAPITIATASGIKTCLVYLDPPSSQATTTAFMGTCSEPIPQTLHINGTPIHLLTTSIGNPHAIVLNPPPDIDFAETAPLIAHHPSFPDGVNVTFATLGTESLHARVWERGVGPTLACGTAACALAAVAVHRQLMPTNTPINIRLPGGPLNVTITADFAAILSGTTHRVFEGTLTIPSETTTRRP